MFLYTQPPFIIGYVGINCNHLVLLVMQVEIATTLYDWLCRQRLQPPCFIDYVGRDCSHLVLLVMQVEIETTLYYCVSRQRLQPVLLVMQVEIATTLYYCVSRQRLQHLVLLVMQVEISPSLHHPFLRLFPPLPSTIPFSSLIFALCTPVFARIYLHACVVCLKPVFFYKTRFPLWLVFLFSILVHFIDQTQIETCLFQMLSYIVVKCDNILISKRYINYLNILFLSCKDDNLISEKYICVYYFEKIFLLHKNNVFTF